MKAPDKIKIGKHNITSDGDVVFVWVTNEPDCEAMQHDIEYTRTDTFIEKACNWLESINLDWYQIREGVFSRQLVEDFKNYMKGE